MNRRGLLGSSVLLLIIASGGGGLAAWKYAAFQQDAAASAHQPEPSESVVVIPAKAREHRSSTTAIGTVLALRSIALRNEVPGTIHTVDLTPGKVVEAGTLLVALDVSVEQAELKANEAQAALAETLLRRVKNMSESRAASETEVDRAIAERDIAVAQIARIKAVIARKTIRAPFRARVGLADVHPGQYLEEGTLLTTLQGVDDSAHVDFTVTQRVAAGLRQGDSVDVFSTGETAPAPATIVAIDAKVDVTTRNAMVRAKIAGGASGPAPGSSVRVRIPVGPARSVVAVPISALRKGPAGDHVFVITADQEGKDRANARRVDVGEALGDEILVQTGLTAGERVATSGSFKLRDAVLVSVVPGESVAQAAR